MADARDWEIAGAFAGGVAATLAALITWAAISLSMTGQSQGYYIPDVPEGEKTNTFA